MRITYVDPGLSSRKGHNASMAFELDDALVRERSHHVTFVQGVRHHIKEHQAADRDQDKPVDKGHQLRTVSNEPGQNGAGGERTKTGGEKG